MSDKNRLDNIEKPFVVRLGFTKLIDHLDQLSKAGTKIEKNMAKDVLSELKHRDVLHAGLEENASYKKYEKDIKLLLSVLFPNPLVNNEIKVALSPMKSEVLYSTDRFNSIFQNLHEVMPKEFGTNEENMIYIYMCCFILGFYYGIPINTKVSPIYDVIDKRGVKKYYKSGYNADFMTIRPIGTPPEIDTELVNKLKENFENLEMWKELFPPKSWEITGFGLKTFTHVSNEESLSLIKNNLIGTKRVEDREEFRRNMSSYIGTLLDVPNIKTAFIMYDAVNKRFQKPDPTEPSFAISEDSFSTDCKMLCDFGESKIFKTKEDFIISDVDQLPEEAFETEVYRSIRDKGVKSYIMTPLYHEEDLLGVLEFASFVSGDFDRTHRYKIDQMKNLCINAVKQFTEEKENQLASVIQKEFTSIHPSVEWKFREEAEKSVMADLGGEHYNFDNISFNNLTALYGQLDIAGSSNARNKAIAADLKAQMRLIKNIIEEMSEVISMPLLDSIQYQIAIINEKLSSDLAAGMEQEVIEFLRITINPLFQELRHRDERLEKSISAYFDKIGHDMEVIYNKRKDYDETVQLINMHLAGRLDKKQVKAQRIYPHFFERYKTDGVEHNIYIGQEISPELPYNKLYLDNLRLWQLKTICELEIEHHNRIPDLPVPLEVASLIMVYSNPLAIRYRMDEKQFDIDGAYNARYEIIKKRIDKAHIKGTKERITQPGKIVIIYTQAADLEEYQNYVNYLTYQGYLVGESELFDIEDLQGVAGLKGLRVNVNFDKDIKSLKKNAKKSTTEKQLA